MNRQEKPSVALQVGELVEDGGLHRDVERRGRLIRHQQQRRGRSSDLASADPLPLAAGELVRIAAAQLRGKADLGQHLVHRGVELPA